MTQLTIHEYIPGTVITEPGIYSGLDIEAYHSQEICDGPSISSSGLRTIFNHGPKAFYVDSGFCPKEEDDEDEEAKKSQEALILGSAAHHLLLGEKAFATKFAIRPEEYPDYRSGEARKWRDFEIKRGRTPLVPKQIAKIRKIAASLQAHPFIQGGILNGYVECSIFWRDVKTGIMLKARPDVIPAVEIGVSADVADFKTTSKMDQQAVDRAIFDLRYDMQGALVGEGLKAVADISMASFSLIFAQTKKPYDVDVVGIDLDQIEAAKDDLRVAIDTFAYCLNSDDWFGAAGREPGIRYARMSKWQETTAQFRRSSLKTDIEV